MPGMRRWYLVRVCTALWTLATTSVPASLLLAAMVPLLSLPLLTPRPQWLASGCAVATSRISTMLGRAEVLFAASLHVAVVPDQCPSFVFRAAVRIGISTAIHQSLCSCRGRSGALLDPV